jgi:thioredoxin 1
MEQLRTENSGVDFLAIDVDENSDLAQKYNVRAVPTVVIEKNGVEISRLMGMKPKTEYQRIITENK